MHLKSLRLYILFLLVALGQTEGRVLYKAENRAEENPLPGHFLNRSKELEYLHDSPSAVKPEQIQQIIDDCCYHILYLRKV